MGTDPVGQCLRPARLGIGEVGGAHNGDENLRRADLAGKPVDDDWHRIAGLSTNSLSPPTWACRIVTDNRDAQVRYSSQNRE